MNDPYGNPEDEEAPEWGDELEDPWDDEDLEADDCPEYDREPT